MLGIDYHVPVLQRFELASSVAFRHDICTGLPAEYETCDLLYADLPWARGIQTFNARAEGHQGYDQFLAATSELVTGARVPVVLITGRHALPRLPRPSWVAPTRLNRHEAIAIMYRLYPRGGGVPRSASDLVASLASEFGRVGDFCCGYGRTLRAFHAAGKSFVGSDYNGRCIGRIAQLFGEGGIARV